MDGRLPGWAADLAGLEASVAAERVRAEGLEVRTVPTAPPWPGQGQGAWRVVRVRFPGPGLVEFCVAQEGYARGGEERS